VREAAQVIEVAVSHLRQLGQAVLRKYFGAAGAVVGIGGSGFGPAFAKLGYRAVLIGVGPGAGSAVVAVVLVELGQGAGATAHAGLAPVKLQRSQNGFYPGRNALGLT